jgi:hypothetical protein
MGLQSDWDLWHAAAAQRRAGLDEKKIRVPKRSRYVFQRARVQGAAE